MAITKAKDLVISSKEVSTTELFAGKESAAAIEAPQVAQQKGQDSSASSQRPPPEPPPAAKPDFETMTQTRPRTPRQSAPLTRPPPRPLPESPPKLSIQIQTIQETGKAWERFISKRIKLGRYCTTSPRSPPPAPSAPAPCCPPSCWAKRHQPHGQGWTHSHTLMTSECGLEMRTLMSSG